MSGARGVPPDTIVETPRLRLRAWRAEDLDALARLCGDPAVMRHFPKPLERAECAPLLARLTEHQVQYGYTYFAAERRDTGAFLGFVGLAQQDLAPALPPCVDVGWRLMPEAWGHGFATEGARAALDLAFTRAGLAEVHAFAPLVNEASIRVMQRLGMARRADFDHPRLVDAPHLQRCAHFVAEAPK